jgi:hypothetical protein
MLTGSSATFTDEYYSGTVNNILGPMVHNIANRYFIHSRCICIITEGNGNILKYIPKSVPIFHIQIGGTGTTIQEIEDSYLLDSSKLTNETQTFERLLTEAMDAGCESYIAQVKNIASVVHSFGRTSRRAAIRSCKKVLYLPATLEGETLPLKDIFSLNEMNHMPDTIIIRFVNVKNLSNFVQYRYENMNYKCKRYESNVVMNLKIDVTATFLEDCHVKSKRQMSFKDIDNGEILREREENKCDASEQDRCTEGQDGTSEMKSRLINFRKASGLNKANDNVNVIELVTLKFVGKNPSAENVLDVWIADDQAVGFLACANLFPDKMRNLEGREIRVTTIHYLPYVVLIHDEKTRAYDGVEWLLFVEFANKVNATWKLVLDEDNLWGTAWPNGSGNGIVGTKYENSILLITASILITIQQYN